MVFNVKKYLLRTVFGCVVGTFLFVSIIRSNATTRDGICESIIAMPLPEGSKRMDASLLRISQKIAREYLAHHVIFSLEDVKFIIDIARSHYGYAYTKEFALRLIALLIELAPAAIGPMLVHYHMVGPGVEPSF
jgi:hypothetical protein